MLSITNEIWQRPLKTMGKIRIIEYPTQTQGFLVLTKKGFKANHQLILQGLCGGPFQTFIPNKGFDVIIYFHDVTNKILSHHTNYIEDIAM